MKHKIASLIVLGIVTCSLTACQNILSMFGIGGGNGGYSYRSIIPDVPTPRPGSTKAYASSLTYEDYAQNNLYPLSVTPSTGEAKLLVIPVWFNDSNSVIANDKKDLVRSDIQAAYFGSNEETGWRSVKTYYEEESHGALTLTGTVSDWYDARVSYMAYADDPEQHNTMQLVADATNWYFTNNSDNRNDYDCDNDGYMDGVMLIYAAPDYDVLKNNNATNLWAYCYWIQNDNTIRNNNTNPRVNAFFWASHDFMYGQEQLKNRTGYSTYKNGDTSVVNIDTHTYIHEMGHMFGLSDYYDYSAHQYKPAAGFSMQDNNVGGHDPFSSFALGWGKAYVPNESTIINLKKFATTGEMIVLTPQWNGHNSAFDEYLIIEYYDTDGLNGLDTTHHYMSASGKGYPKGSQEKGIRLWHVDARLLYSTSKNFSPSRISTTTDNGLGNKVTLLNSNTYVDGNKIKSDSDYVSPLARTDSKYASYNLLQMIHNNKNATHESRASLNNSDPLFKADDVFSMSEYGKQFVNQGKFNSDKELGFTFKVNALNKNYASITITKL